MTTVVLGLDGAAFELIRDWIDSGRLPNLKRVSTEGTAMDMQSWIPPVTCPNWRCYASGVNPGKLGVFWWERVSRSTQSMEPTSSSEQFDGGEYWSLIDGDVSIINFPTGSPPSTVNGEFIAGGPGSEQTNYTYPTHLERGLQEEYEYQVHPEQLSKLSKDDQGNECVEEIYRLIKQRFEVLEDRLESGDYSLIHVTVFYINVLHHFYWDREIVRTAWEPIDDRIGNLLGNDELDRLFVMSDHGSNRIETEFHINTWLEQEGYLVRQTGASDLMQKLGITRDRVRPLMNRFGRESVSISADHYEGSKYGDIKVTFPIGPLHCHIYPRFSRWSCNSPVTASPPSLSRNSRWIVCGSPTVSPRNSRSPLVTPLSSRSCVSRSNASAVPAESKRTNRSSWNRAT